MAQHAALHRAEAQGGRAARSEKLEWLARAGLVARGVVYAVVGLLAIKVALGDGGKTTSQQGALATIAKQPLGTVLVALLAIGLLGYASWRLLRGVLGHGREDSDDTKDRIADLASGIAYGALFITSVSILFGSKGGGGSPDKATGGVLGWPGGQVLVIIAGLVMVGVGLDQARKGIQRKFLEDSKTEQMSEPVEKAFTALGVAGHLARTAVFALIGYFLIRAAIEFNPDKAVGLDGALAALGKASYGPLVLGIVAAGLLCFAAYSVADARYRKV